MKKKIFALMLAVVMTVCMIPAAVFAVDVEPGGTVDNGLELNKTYDKENNLLTLEAWVTGTSVTTTTETVVPCDIVLVLDVSGSMDERIGGNGTPHKIDALKTAVAGFVDTVAANAKANNVDHRISIVKFADNSYYNNSESSLAEGNHRYWDWGDYYNYTEVVKNLTSVNTGVNALKTAVNDLTPGGATSADYGMTKAKYVLADSNVNRKDSTKVVVMFTDGEPNHSSGFSYSVANNTIAISKGLKADGVKVYSVGVFGTLNPNDSDDYRIIQYMNSVSSNYSNANGATKNGNRYTWDMGNGGDLGYYYNASDAADLSAIFKKIAESSTTGGAAIQLTETSTLVDQVTEWFDLPENVSKEDIHTYTSKCKSVSAKGEYTWEDRVEQNFDVEIDEENKIIKVSGFDYAENWVGTDTTTGAVHGQKLIVTIPIYDNGTGKGPDVPTNTAISGVYDGDEPIEYFPIPETEFPYITIKHSSGAPDEIIRIDQLTYNEDGESFDIKPYVVPGYLYGGRYTGPGYTWDEAVKSGDHGNPDVENYATYYLKEVPDTYLVPKTLTTWHVGESGKEIDHLYLITTVDDENYLEIGFKCKEIDDISKTAKEGSAFDTTGDALCKQIDIYRKPNLETPETTYEYKHVHKIRGDEDNDGYIACYKVNAFDGKMEMSYIPFFRTPDDVLVNGIVERTITVPNAINPIDFDAVDNKVTVDTYIGYDWRDGGSQKPTEPLKVAKTLSLGNETDSVPKTEPVKKIVKGKVVKSPIIENPIIEEPIIAEPIKPIKPVNPKSSIGNVVKNGILGLVKKLGKW